MNLINEKEKQIALISKISAIILAVIVGLALILLIGQNPIESLTLIFRGAFGSKTAIATTISKMSTLILTGLSYAIAYRAGLINIGAEGQMYIGALFTSLAVLYIPGPGYLVMIIAIAAGLVGGALTGGLIALLKIMFGANEVITTVMFNYIAQYLILFMVNGPIQDPNSGSPQTILFDEQYWLPWIHQKTRLHSGVIIMIIALIFYGMLLWKHRIGYEIRSVGISQEASRYAGMSAHKNQALAMLMAGGFAGLAGAIEVLGVQHRLLSGVASNFGFDGMAVALLGGSTPVGMLLSGLLVGALDSGGNSLQMFSKVPVSVVDMIRAMVIIFVLIDLVKHLYEGKEQKRRMKNGN